MSNAKSHHPLETEQELQAMKRGIPDVMTNQKTCFFKGLFLDEQGFTQLVQGVLDYFENVTQLRARLALAVAERDSKDAAARQFVSDLRAAAITNYGEGSIEFALLGFTSRRKPAPLTPEKKQLKYLRTMATRKARMVMGSRQRQEIKGEVDPGPGETTGG
jgi:hypothetical protein